MAVDGDALTKDLLLGARKVNSLDTSGLLDEAGHRWSRLDSRGPDQARRGDKGAPLDGRRGQLACQGCSESLCEAFGCHCDLCTEVTSGGAEFH